MNKQKSFSTIPKYRQWNKVIQPLLKFNRNSSIYGYPLDFYYELQKIISTGHHILHINIVTTLSGSNDNCIKTIFQKQQQIGKVIFQKAILKSNFDNQIEHQQHQRINKLCQKDSQYYHFYQSLKASNHLDQLLPYAIIKQKNVDEESTVNKTSILNRDQYKKILHVQPNKVAQSFVWGSLKQSSLTRFFYFHNKKNSVAYQIDNYENIIKKRFGKGQFKIKQQKQNSITFVKIMYSNKSFYNQTCILVNFLQKHLKVKIEKIVTDWILDPFNKYFMVDVKEIIISDRIQPIILQPVQDSLSYITCGVCQQKFKVEELKKILTDKLIYVFFEHLKKRQIVLSFKPLIKKKISDLTKVCQLCFMLVITQSQLIKLENNLAMITKSVDKVQEAPPQIKKNSQFNSLHEWRLFLYIEDIRNLIIDDYVSSNQYYLMIKIHQSVTSFNLKNINGNYYLLKGIKMHYLLSEDRKIDDFLLKTQINVRITKGPSWNDVIAEGCTNGLFELNEKHTMRKFKQILVFDIKSRYSVVGIHIGLKLEGRLQKVDYELKKFHNVYMIQNYGNCYEFPAQWMQTIDPSYCISKSELPCLSYNFHLSKMQKKMLFPDKKPNKLKLT